MSENITFTVESGADAQDVIDMVEWMRILFQSTLEGRDLYQKQDDPCDLARELEEMKVSVYPRSARDGYEMESFAIAYSGISSGFTEWFFRDAEGKMHSSEDMEGPDFH